MKKCIVSLLLVIVLSLSASSMVFAGPTEPPSPRIPRPTPTHIHICMDSSVPSYPMADSVVESDICTDLAE